MTNTQYLKLQSAALRDASLALTPAADTALTIRNTPDGPLETKAERRQIRLAMLAAMRIDPIGTQQFLAACYGVQS